MGVGGEVDVVEIADRFEDLRVGLRHGQARDEFRPAVDPSEDNAGVITSRGHARADRGDTLVNTRRGEGLEAALARAVDDEVVAVPFRLGREEIDRADEA